MVRSARSPWTPFRLPRLAAAVTALACLGLAGCPAPFTASDEAGEHGDAALDAKAPAEGDAAAADAGPTDQSVAEDSDSPPEVAAGCLPECPAWQVCEGSTCAAKTCAADPECNPPAPVPGQDPHFCFHGKCAAFQCAEDGDCPSGQKCNTAIYRCYSAPTGCTGHAGCVDADPCTVDTCDFPSGKCLHDKDKTCCKTAADCNDAIACTIDTCPAGKCVNEPKGDCCSGPLDCGDGNPCTDDGCVNGQCVFTKKAACCASAATCDDGEDASNDLCHQQKCIHQWPGLATACTGTCPSNACLSSACVSGQCSYAPIPGAKGCCTSDAGCSVSQACMVGSCTGGVCGSKPAVGVGAHVRYRFDLAALDGWQVQKDHPTVYFHFSTLSAVAGAGSLRYGVPGVISFESGNANKGSVQSPVLTLPATSAAVRFWVFLDAEPGSAVHQAGLDVIDVATGAATVGVWNKNKDLQGTTAGAWKLQETSLAAFAGKKVRLRFWFDQMKYDLSNKNKMGFVVDELEVLGGCP